MFRYLSLFFLQFVLLLVSLLMIWLRNNLLLGKVSFNSSLFYDLSRPVSTVCYEICSAAKLGFWSWAGAFQLSLEIAGHISLVIVIHLSNTRIENLAVHDQNICYLIILLNFDTWLFNNYILLKKIWKIRWWSFSRTTNLQSSQPNVCSQHLSLLRFPLTSNGSE